MRFWHNSTEITKDVTKYAKGSYSLNYLVNDFIYIASDFPFNHLYARILVGALVSANMKVEYYSTRWTEAVDVQDETLGFSNEGYIDFTPEKKSNWQMKDSEDLQLPFKVYEKYWTRISFDSPLTASIDYLGVKFSDDLDLYGEFPIFDNSDYKTAFKTGKSDWEEQALVAAYLIVQDLKKRNIIFGAEQLLDRNLFIGASVQKTAELIYTSFGNDYLTQKENARIEYGRRLDLSQFGTDTNKDGILQNREVEYRQQWISR